MTCWVSLGFRAFEWNDMLGAVSPQVIFYGCSLNPTYGSTGLRQNRKGSGAGESHPIIEAPKFNHQSPISSFQIPFLDSPLVYFSYHPLKC